MKLIRTYKYKLRPNATQNNAFEQIIGSCRFLYNCALEHRITAYQSGKSVNYYDQANELPSIKKTEGLEWLNQVPSQTLQDVLERLNKTYQAFFKGAGFPKFAKKGLYRSFAIKQGIKIENNKIRLPKIGWIRFFNSRKFEGKIKYATIVKELDAWYISICVEKQPTIRSKKQAVGIDLGVVRLATLSDGSHYENPMFLKRYASELRILQRKLARCITNSIPYQIQFHNQHLN